MYKIANNTGNTYRISDNKLIAPGSSTDPDYIGYQQWISEGNTPEYFVEELPDVEVKVSISVQDFKERFTMEEIAAFVTLAKTDITAELILLDAQVAENVVLNDDKVVNGMNYLVYKGILTPDRATQILT